MTTTMTNDVAIARAIMRVMADGRERTINDIRVKIGGDPDKVRHQVNVLVKAKRIRTSHIGGGRDHHETIYRAAKEAAE